MGDGRYVPGFVCTDNLALSMRPRRAFMFRDSGCGVTAGVLMAGLVAFKKGNTAVSQAMMRARVLAQGATVALMAGTSGKFTCDGVCFVEGLACAQ